MLGNNVLCKHNWGILIIITERLILSSPFGYIKLSARHTLTYIFHCSDLLQIIQESLDSFRNSTLHKPLNFIIHDTTLHTQNYKTENLAFLVQNTRPLICIFFGRGREFNHTWQIGKPGTKEIGKKGYIVVHYFYYTRRIDTRNGSVQINWCVISRNKDPKILSRQDKYKLHSSFSSSPILSIIACKSK